MKPPHRAMMRAPCETLADIVGVPVEELPRVFQGRFPCVLKVGIKADLVARYPDADPVRIGRWLFRFCGSRMYLLRVVRGTWRHDLDGEHVAMIDGFAKEMARKRLDERKRHNTAKEAA